MNFPRQMSDYEKTVSLIAGRLYSAEMVERIKNLKDEDEGIPVDQVMSEAVVDASEIVDKVFELTRSTKSERAAHSRG